MSLIVAGATGAIGRCVVREALRRVEITRVVALTRSSLISDPATLFNFTIVNTEAEVTENSNTLTQAQLSRLLPITFDWELFCRFWEKRRLNNASFNVNNNDENKEYIGGSYESALEYYKNIFSGHQFAANCLGTTRHDAGSAAAFIRCDFDYVIAFAEAIKTFNNNNNSLTCYTQISAQLANKNSWLLYGKTKGKADAAVEELQFPRLCIYRPGLLDRGSKTRINEKIAKFFIGGLPVETCGRAVVRDFVHCSNGINTSQIECAGVLANKNHKNNNNNNNNNNNTGANTFYFSNKAIKKEAYALL